jgi:hypothetical protein
MAKESVILRNPADWLK